MVWLRPGWLREGPGIDKDAPRKPALPCFLRFLSANFGRF